MSQYQKALLAILSGTKDAGIAFADLQAVLDRLGFQLRTKGDHFIYIKDSVEEIINLQPKVGKAISGQASPTNHFEVSLGRYCQ